MKVNGDRERLLEVLRLYPYGATLAQLESVSYLGGETRSLLHDLCNDDQAKLDGRLFYPTFAEARNDHLL